MEAPIITDTKIERKGRTLEETRAYSKHYYQTVVKMKHSKPRGRPAKYQTEDEYKKHLKAYTQKYYKENKEKLLAAQKQRYNRIKDTVKEYKLKAESKD